jgi:hypothetical protein
MTPMAHAGSALNGCDVGLNYLRGIDKSIELILRHETELHLNCKNYTIISFSSGILARVALSKPRCA